MSTPPYKIFIPAIIAIFVLAFFLAAGSEFQFAQVLRSPSFRESGTVIPPPPSDTELTFPALPPAEEQGTFIPPPSQPIGGSCGSSVNFCTSGAFEDIVDSSLFHLWNCKGIRRGSSASCSIKKAIPPPPQATWTSIRETTGSIGTTLTKAVVTQYDINGTPKRPDIYNNFHGSSIRVKAGDWTVERFAIQPRKNFTLGKVELTLSGTDDAGNAVEAEATLNVEKSSDKKKPYRLAPCKDGSDPLELGLIGGWGSCKPSECL